MITYEYKYNFSIHFRRSSAIHRNLRNISNLAFIQTLFYALRRRALHYFHTKIHRHRQPRRECYYGQFLRHIRHTRAYLNGGYSEDDVIFWGAYRLNGPAGPASPVGRGLWWYAAGPSEFSLLILANNSPYARRSSSEQATGAGYILRGEYCSALTA